MSSKRKFLLWWRKTGFVFRATLFLLGSLIIASLLYLQPPTAIDKLDDLTSPLLFFVLINLTIVVTIVMALLIGRNFVKLIFDRRRRILGSKLRMRLVLAFVGFTLIPIILLFLLASGLITDALSGWFGKQIAGTVEGAVEVGQAHYAALEREVQHFSEVLGGDLEHINPPTTEITQFLIKKRSEYALSSISVLKQNREPVAQSGSVATTLESLKEPPPNGEAVNRAYFGKPVTLREQEGGSEFLRVYSLVRIDGQPLVLLVSQRIQPEISAALGTVVASYDEYRQLEFNKQPLRSSYLLMLTMFTVLILFSAVWFGFYLARELTEPIQRLAEGTNAVAAGNYDFSIHPVGDDELAFLVRSFNRMISDLKQSRSELEKRGRYIETVLANLAVAVISLDTEGRINVLNPAALRLFAHNEPDGLIGKKLDALFSPGQLAQVRELQADVAGSQENNLGMRAVEKRFTLISGGRELQIICTAGAVRSGHGESLGSVIILDDVTDLSKAQHMAAWREVARRIAHEIKNPLTPIQLAAQRLEKLLAGAESGTAVSESTQTIVKYVDSIKRLANEFSNFARMPTAELHEENLNLLISELLVSYATIPHLSVQFIPDSTLPLVWIDREQIRRALINLLDNAVDAMIRDGKAVCESPTIVIKTEYLNKQTRYALEIRDNGPGIAAPDKARIFEPYYTTKPGGTGLGLAIVNTIVADHHGDISVFDNNPRGTRFNLELPISPEAQTQRRYGIV